MAGHSTPELCVARQMHDANPAMKACTPPVESFLAHFHDSRPGLTPKALSALPVTFRGQRYASSYEILASVVPSTSQSIEVLDLACGDGFLLALLASRAQPHLSLSGVDLSAGELAVAAQRLGHSIPLIQARAQELPCADGHLQYVLCHMALMLMDDVENVLREIRRALRSGGTFAAIIGAPPHPSPVLALYSKALSKHSRQEQWSTVRFGDARLRTREGIASLFSHIFSDVVIEELHIPVRFSPDELWLWFTDMYDLYLFAEEDRQTIKHELLEGIAPMCALDGKLEYSLSMRYAVMRK